MSELRPPRDPKMLLTEVSACIKIKDIKRLYDLRDKVRVKWYESGLVAMLFVAALTFLVVVVNLLPDPNPVVRDFLVGSSVALVLIVTAVLEFLLHKFRAMRRLFELQSRLIEELDKGHTKMQQEVAKLAENVTVEKTNDEEKTASS